MGISDSEIERLYGIPQNEAICRYILQERRSAHSDVAEELDRASALLPKHNEYCPSPQGYAYVILYTLSDIIFAAAFGMKALLFRLPKGATEEAKADGGSEFADLPPEWAVFDPFRADRQMTANRRRMRRWCEVAYANAISDSNRRQGVVDRS